MSTKDVRYGSIARMAAVNSAAYTAMMRRMPGVKEATKRHVRYARYHIKWRDFSEERG